MAAGDLCAYDNVVSYLPGYRSNDTIDQKIVNLITAESEQFAADAAIEIISTGSQPAERVFAFNRGDQPRIHIGALASTESLAVTLLDDDDAATTVDTADVIAFYGPRRQQTAAWQPITELELRNQQILAATKPPREQLVRVTGTYGFPSIPTFVSEAVAATVILRYISDVATAGTDLADALDSINIRGLVARRQNALDTLHDLQPPFIG